MHKGKRKHHASFHLDSKQKIVESFHNCHLRNLARLSLAFIRFGTPSRSLCVCVCVQAIEHERSREVQGPGA